MTQYSDDDEVITQDIIDEITAGQPAFDVQPVSYDYFVQVFSFRSWFGALRYNWRIVAQNGQIILSSNQGYSNRQDRDDVIGHFIHAAKINTIDPNPRMEDIYS